MSKKNWRESAGSTSRPTKSSAPAVPGKSSPAKSTGYARLRQGIWLLAAAAGLGLLINLFLNIIPPDKKTSLIFCPNIQQDTILSTSAFLTETKKSCEEVSNDNLTFIEASYSAVAGREIQNSKGEKVVANGPDENLALFYIHADRFLDSASTPVLTKNGCLDGQGNLKLHDFLLQICATELGVENAHRIVFLDSGRLNISTAAGLVPGAFADAAKAAIQRLRDDQVVNSDRLWLFLSHGNNQFGWTSPELNNTVFGYFVTAGLEGKADLDNDKLVDLKELSEYVTGSVANWAANYRDSVQYPVLIGNDDIAPETVRVIHTLRKPKQLASGLSTAHSTHELLWRRAYRLEAPHSRVMAFARLARLEQIRYCKSPEYISLHRDTKKFIQDAELEKDPQVYQASLFEILDPNGLTAAQSTSCVDDLIAYLNAPPSDPPKDPELGDAFKNLSAHKRAVAVWDFVQSAENYKDWFDAEAFETAVELAVVSESQAGQTLPDEWQYLLLLKNSVAWDKSNFSMDAVSAAVRVRDLSNRMVRGQLPIASGERAENVEGFQREWYLIADQFDQLESKRRVAEDKLIAGEFSVSKSEFKGLESGYSKLAAQLRFLIECRNRAESSLAISPFLKSFVVRDLINRGTANQDKLERIRAAVTELEQSSVQLLNGLNKSDFGLIDKANKTAGSATTEIQKWLLGTIRAVLDEQRASKYVFEGLLLLESPLLEWIEATTDLTEGTRSQISTRVQANLVQQQTDFVNTQLNKDDLPEHVEFDEASKSELRRSVVDWLAKDRLTNSILGDQGNFDSWETFQELTAKLPTIDSLLKDRKETSFDQMADVRAELLRLEIARSEILKSGYSMAFGSQSIDMCQQRKWFEGYAFAVTKMERAGLDFWGNGLASSATNIPFTDYILSYQKDATGFSNRLGLSKLGINKLVPYDSKSLPALVNSFSDRAQKLRDSVAQIAPVISLNENAVVEKASVDPRTNNSLTSSIAELDEVLGKDELFSRSTASHYLSQNRMEVGSDGFYGDNPIRLQPLRKRTGVSSTRKFRGHHFKSSVNLSPLVIVEPKKTVFNLEPNWQKPTASTVTVENKVDNTADLYFLLDCSGSMTKQEEVFETELGGKVSMTRFDFMKSTLNLTINNLVRDRRFHMGLAAFSHRGQFLIDKNGQPYDSDGDGNWEVKGGAVGVSPFVDCETAFPPDSLTTELEARRFESYVKGLEALGETPLYFSIKTTLESFRSSRPKILIVLTDGVDNQSNMVTGYNKINDETYVTGPKLADLLKNRFRETEVIALQINKAAANPMPAGIEVATLNSNSQRELIDLILDAVGRNQFSVVGTNETVSDPDKKRIGTSTFLNVETPKQFMLRTHEVSAEAERALNLVGGENLRFLNTRDGLEIDRRESQKAAAGFIVPKINDVRIGDGNYEVGILPSNRNRVVRFGFNNRRELGAIPQRVWAMVTDSKGRSFQLSRPRISYATLPVVEFELPGDLDAEWVDMKLFVKPSQFGLPEEAVAVEPHAFKSDGTHDGIQYKVKQVDGSDSQFLVELTSEKPIGRPFFLDSPNSRPFGDRQVNTIRSIEFADENRVAERYVFDIASGKEAVFELTVDSEDKVQASSDTFPKETGFANVVDPIFGDPVVCIRFSKIKLRK